MHLLIDGQALQTSTSRQRGIGRYSSNLLRTLAVARPSWRIEVVQNNALKPIASDDLNGLPVLSFQPPLPVHPDQRELNERYYADWLTARGADGVLVLSHCEGWEALIPAFCGRRPPVFGIAYDLIPLLYPEHYFTDFATARWYALRFQQLLQSDALLAISEATASDVRMLVGAEAPLVVNIGGAVDPLFVPLSPAELAVRAREARRRFGLHREFILYLGAPDYRKNLHGAIRAFAALPEPWRSTLDLAVVCRMKAAERKCFDTAARQAGVASSLRFIACVNDEDLRSLYQTCRLFFFPSLYEGMGLPVLEALRCGAPVVTSNCSSLPEYAGPYSWLGDPTSPPTMAQLLQQALAEPRDAFRSEREAFARTFSWKRTADLACRTMERTMRRRGISVRRRRRLAWVMSLSTSCGGTIDYAAGLLPHLADHFEIEVVSFSDPLQAPEVLARHHPILTVGEVRARHASLPYDLFVYQLSPTENILDLLALLWQFPGLVVLHEFAARDLQKLMMSNLIGTKSRDDLCGRGEGASSEFSPILGIMVHDVETCQYLHRVGKVPLVHQPRTSATSDRVAIYADWINRAIAQQEQNDRLWLGFARRCLADHADEAGSIIDAWASLRAHGQQQPPSARTYALLKG